MTSPLQYILCVIFIFNLLQVLVNGCTCTNPEMSAEDKQAILKAHNTFRQKVANGNEDGQPKASNMNELVWSDDLQTTATEWASECQSLTHNHPESPNFDYVGQNIWIQWSTGDLEEDMDYNKAISDWYNEVVKPGFDSKNIDPFVFGDGYGHYTQVVWADTTSVGCGYCNYEADDYDHQLLVCNYGPGGNVISTTMYKQGDPCSDCPDKCSDNYPGLCTSS